MSRPPRARTAPEMEFAASLEPCAKCGTTRLGDLVMRGAGEAWAYSMTCPVCGAARAFSFATHGDPLDTPNGEHELGPGASELIGAAVFLGELERATARVVDRPIGLSPTEWRASAAANERALVIVNELMKLGAGPEIELDDPRLRRAWLEAERGRRLAVAAAYAADAERVATIEEAARGEAPIGGLGRAELAEHEAWVRGGRQGPGRLVVERVHAERAKLGAAELTGARLIGVVAPEIDLAYAALDDADLVEVDFARANLTSVSLCGAQLRLGSFARAQLGSAKLDRAIIDGSDFTGAELDRTTWHGAKVSRAQFVGARFGNASLADAQLRRCELARASFAAVTKKPIAETRGAVFTDCDLRDTDWAGRALDDAQFIRCKLAGAHGKAATTAGLVVKDCDVTAEQLIAQLR